MKRLCVVFSVVGLSVVFSSLVALPLLAAAQTGAPAAVSVPAPVAVPAAAVASATAASPKAAASKAVGPRAAPVAIASKPAWADLTPPQQLALKPLTATWNGINEAQKRKWLEVSKNYPGLKPAEQATMHSRMNEWVAMTPQDRAAARLNFAKTKELSKQLTPDEKKAKWETYQALSPEEKAKLAAKASPKPAGAATAVKPVPVQKLAVTPKSVPPLPKLPAGTATTTTGETVLGVVTPGGPAN